MKRRLLIWLGENKKSDIGKDTDPPLPFRPEETLDEKIEIGRVISI
jgi:hypothetical protein